VLLASVLYAAVKPQADALGVSADDFQHAICGDVIPAASDAILSSLAVFFPGAQSRLLKKVLQLTAEARRHAETEADRMLASPELEESISRALSTPLNSPTASPASSASTPAP
jgi:hypothetical protein